MSQPSVEPFDSALPFILRWEGGFVDDPADHGGRTMKGVTQRVYTAYRAQRGLPDQDVKLIAEEEIRAIYHERYWLTGQCQSLRSHLDLAQFDTAVNMGPVRAVKILQEATGCAADGVFGPSSQAACDSCDLDTTLIQYCTIREGLYRKFAQQPGQAKFLKGWLGRLNALRAEIGLPGSDVSFGDVSGEISFAPPISDLAPEQPLEAWQ